MLFGLFNRDRFLSRAERMRRDHERWLQRALDDGVHYPRIPVRPVREGGFSAMMARATGRRAAEAWWDRTFDAVDALDRL